jgi:opacity protein-like surface antigen
MGSLRILALAGALASVTASAALAGDLPPPSVAIPEPPAEASYGDDSGIYLRGDVGVGITNTSSLSVVPNGTFNTLTTSGADVSESFFASAGIGYAYNSWLRFDVTGEYRGGASLSGRDAVNYGVGAAGRDQTNVYGGNLSSAVAMLNAYVDLGTFCQLGCITPYVGGGIGYSHNMISGLTDQSTIRVANPVFGTGAFFDSTSGHGSGSEGDLAWALMAGFGYKVNEKLTLDLGYRYINLGDSPAVAVINDATGANGGTVQWRKLDSHDIKLGMRWTLGSDCCAEAEQPIMRKY